LKHPIKFNIKFIKIQDFLAIFSIYSYLFLVDSKYENIVIRINALRVQGFKNKYLKDGKNLKFIV